MGLESLHRQSLEDLGCTVDNDKFQKCTQIMTSEEEVTVAEVTKNTNEETITKSDRIIADKSDAFHTKFPLFRCCRAILCCICWIAAGIFLSIICGPLFFWNWFWLQQHFRAFSAKYNCFVSGVIINSTTVDGSEGGNWYGITYEYHYHPAKDDIPTTITIDTEEAKPEEKWVRTRHYIKIPGSFTSDFSPPPQYLEPGQSIRLVMIPGEAASALPVESLRAMNDWWEASNYIRSRRGEESRLLSCIETSSFLNFFAFVALAVVLYQLELEYEFESAWKLLLTIYLSYFLVLGPPMAYYHHCLIYNKLVFGGEKKESGEIF